MARILISVVPASGHVNPMLAIAHVLRKAGHDIAFTTARDYQPQINRAGFHLYPMAYPEGAVEAIHDVFRRPSRWIEQLMPSPPQSAFFRHLHPLTESIIVAINDFKPDVLLNDINQYAGPIAADVCNLPYAGYCAIVNSLLSRDAPPFGMGLDWAAPGNWRRWLWPPLRLAVHIAMWRMDRIVNRVRRAYGLQPIHGALLAPSPYLTLIPVTEAYEYERSDLPRQVMYVGPVTTAHRGETHDDFPWEWFDQDKCPTLYVSMGTIVEGDAVFRHVIDLAKDASWKAVIALGRKHHSTEYKPLPDNVVVRQFVPQLEILPQVDAVISHGGNNTVTETLLHGLPLVVIPISADQPDSAAHVQASGAGIRVSPWRLTKRKLKTAIERVLNDPAYRQHAQRIQASYRQTDGPQTSARLIELLIETRQPVLRPSGMKPTILLDDVVVLREANRVQVNASTQDRV